VNIKLRTIHEALYFGNAVVLLPHQIDAAYWHEWRLFALPGGIQLFLAMNVPIVAVVLFGLRQLAANHASGKVFSWILIGSGFFAASFHSYFLLQGDQAFQLTASIGCLIATFVLSLLQGIVLWRIGPTKSADVQEG
jgi:general stress protein CsbA